MLTRDVCLSNCSCPADEATSFHARTLGGKQCILCSTAFFCVFFNLCCPADETMFSHWIIFNGKQLFYASLHYAFFKLCFADGFLLLLEWQWISLEQNWHSALVGNFKQCGMLVFKSRDWFLEAECGFQLNVEYFDLCFSSPPPTPYYTHTYTHTYINMHPDLHLSFPLLSVYLRHMPWVKKWLTTCSSKNV